jgi:DNA adenine methylase
MSKLFSPLRYPGGKSNLVEYVSKLLESNGLTGCDFYEPYVGGASLSLALLSTNLINRAIWVEKDPLIYSFWYCVLNIPNDLCRAIIKTKVTIETWKEFQKYRDLTIDPSGFSPLELGLAGLFFNRTNFSGVLKAGPIGGMGQDSKYLIDCRFNNKQRIIDLIRDISQFASKIEVYHSDALAFLKKQEKKLTLNSDASFVYIDPPYYKQGRQLYRYFYNDSQHDELAKFIKNQKFFWLISYDNHDYISNLYQSKLKYKIHFDYRMKSARKAEELLISNLPIPPECLEMLLAI